MLIHYTIAIYVVHLLLLHDDDDLNKINCLLSV